MLAESESTDLPLAGDVLTMLPRIDQTFMQDNFS